MPRFLWKSEEERAREWAFANKHLISEGNLKPNGTKVSRKDFPGDLSHSFMVIDNQIIALSGKGIYLGSGICSQAKLATTENGQLIALKITRLQKHEAGSKKEASIASDLGLVGELTYSTRHAGKHYLAYKYLGVDLDRFLRKNSLITLDDCYQLCVKIALQLHDLHSGNKSKSKTGYLHADIHKGNVVIDEHNNPHFIDFDRAHKIKDSYGEDITNLLLLFFRPIKERKLKGQCWIFDDWMAEYQLFIERPESPEKTERNSIYIYIDPVDKKEDGSYSVVHYLVRDSKACKEGIVPLEGLSIPKPVYNKESGIGEAMWLDGQFWHISLNEEESSILETQVLKIASENGDIKSRENRSQVLFNLLKDPYSFWGSTKCPTPIDVALTLSLCRLGLEHFSPTISQFKIEPLDLIHLLNATSKQVLAVYEKISAFPNRDNNLLSLKNYLWAVLISASNPREVDVKLGEYLNTLPAEQASIMEIEVRNLGDVIKTAKLESADKTTKNTILEVVSEQKFECKQTSSNQTLANSIHLTQFSESSTGIVTMPEPQAPVVSGATRLSTSDQSFSILHLSFSPDQELSESKDYHREVLIEEVKTVNNPLDSAPDPDSHSSDSESFINFNANAQATEFSDAHSPSLNYVSPPVSLSDDASSGQQVLTPITFAQNRSTPELSESSNVQQVITFSQESKITASPSMLLQRSSAANTCQIAQDTRSVQKDITSASAPPTTENLVAKNLSSHPKSPSSSNICLQVFCGVAIILGAVALIIALGVLNVLTAGTATGIALAIGGGIGFFGGGIGLAVSRCKNSDDNQLAPEGMSA